jgi:4-amino-4-deoxy-L-arabinose transferase-like glycosyltransferase
VTHRRLLGAIVLAAAGLRLWGIGFGLPHPMTRPDEEFLIGKALGIFGDYNPHFFEWPSLYFYVVHAVLRVVYWAGRLAGSYRDTSDFIQASGADPAWIYLTLRLMSATAGTATVLVVHGICRVLLDRRTAAIAAFLLAVAYLHVRDSHFGVLDVPLTLLVVVTVRVLAAAWVSPRPVVPLICAGVTAGLASSIKYNAAALLAPCGVAAALKLAEASRLDRVRMLAAGVGCLLLFVAAFVAGSPYVVLDSAGFREGIGAQVTRLSGGHGIAIANVWRQHLTFSLWHGVGGPVLVAAALGLAYLTWRDWRRRRSWRRSRSHTSPSSAAGTRRSSGTRRRWCRSSACSRRRQCRRPRAGAARPHPQRRRWPSCWRCRRRSSRCGSIGC